MCVGKVLWKMKFEEEGRLDVLTLVVRCHVGSDTAELARHVLGAAHDAEEVTASQAREVVPTPAALDEFRKQVWVLGHVLESLRYLLSAN